MRKFPLLIITLFSYQHFFAQDWKWVNPKPCNSSLFDIHFAPSKQFGGACGEMGTIITTTDGGVNWSLTILPGEKIFNAIFWVDENHGFVCGETGTIYKTSNAGANWQNISYPTLKNLHDVFFNDSNSGYVVGDSGLLLKTSNGGVTWDSTTITTVNLNAVFFTQPSTGFTAGDDGKLFKTINGGSTWTAVPNTYTNKLTTISFSGVDTGYVAGDGASGRFLSTTNGGATWQSIDAGIAQEFTSLQYLDNQTLVAATTGGSFCKSTDGGITWSTQNLFFSYLTLYFTNSSTGILVGIIGQIINTSDLGNNWSLGQTGPVSSLMDVSFGALFPGSANNYGYAVSLEGGIYQSVDNGENWELQINYGSALLYKVHAVNAATAFVACNNDIIRTTNGGIIWEFQNIGLDDVLDIYFLDHQKGYFVGSSGYFITTDDAGETWEKSILPDAPNLRGVHFINPDTGYVVGENGAAYKTINGGINWQQFDVGTTFNLNDVFFTDANVGFIGGEGAAFFKTMDGGNTWVPYQGLATNIHEIFFFNKNIGYIAGTLGKIYQTIDGGASWNLEQRLTTYNINGLDNSGTNTLFAVGAIGTIIKNENADFSHTHSVHTNANPVKLLPNPTGGTTTIFPTDCQAGLISIFDVQGVERIRQQLPQSCSHDLDVSQLPAGVYFVRYIGEKTLETGILISQ